MLVSDFITEMTQSGSWIRAMFEEGIALKKQYGADNVFDLSLGNPIMEPPEEFLQEFRRLANNPEPGMHRYMSNAGYPETRAAVAKQLENETGVKFTENEIIMTCGAAGALNAVIKTVLDQGDETVAFAPFFVEYVNYTKMYNGMPRIISFGDNFIPKMDELEAVISPRTKCVIVNSPHNPTGIVYSEEVLHRIGEVIQKKEAEYGTKILLISDEPYRKIIYDGLEYPPIWKHHPNSVSINSHSKDLALAGERIGYIAINPDCAQKSELTEGFVYCNRTLGYVNASALMQRLVTRLQNVTVSVAEYQRKRDFMYENLVDMGYSLVKPQGAFYMFPRAPIDDDVAFIKELLQNMVITSPGIGFGAPGYFRLAYCVDDRTLEGSLDGFRKVAKKYGMC